MRGNKNIFLFFFLWPFWGINAQTRNKNRFSTMCAQVRSFHVLTCFPKQQCLSRFCFPKRAASLRPLVFSGKPELADYSTSSCVYEKAIKAQVTLVDAESMFSKVRSVIPSVMGRCVFLTRSRQALTIAHLLHHRG